MGVLYPKRYMHLGMRVIVLYRKNVVLLAPTRVSSFTFCMEQHDGQKYQKQ